MRTRMICACLLMMVTMFATIGQVRADDDGSLTQCGTAYPGWWKKIVDSRSLLVAQVVGLRETGVDRANGMVIYTVTFALQNRTQTDSPAGALNLTHQSLATSNGHSDGGYWNPDDTFNPNNPGSPRAIMSRDFSQVSVPAVPHGSIVYCDGSVRVAFRSNAQLLTGEIVR